MTTMTPIEAHEQIAASAKSPLTEMRYVEKIAVGEFCRQGDVYLLRISKHPSEWKEKTKNRQLAPGATQGSRHILAAGPTIYAKPTGADILLGPVIVAKDRFVLEHPEHAHFSLPAGTYQCRYQQDYAEKERRAVRD